MRFHSPWECATLPPTRSVSGRDGRRGFTLVEVLIAMALMMAVVGTSFAFLQNLLATRERLMVEAARQRSATIAIDRIEAAILTCIAGDARNGAGISGDSQSISILARGVAAYEAEAGLHPGPVLGDLQRIELKFSKGSGVLDGRASSVRMASTPSDPEAVDGSSDPAGGNDPANASEGDQAFWPLGSFPVVRFRYHDGNEWLDSFDSLSAGRLPAAVEIAIWFEPWPGPAEEVDVADLSEPERAFDEDAFAMQSELELYFDIPRPDRIRVIAIADPGPDDGESVELPDEELVE